MIKTWWLCLKANLSCALVVCGLCKTNRKQTQQNSTLHQYKCTGRKWILLWNYLIQYTLVTRHKNKEKKLRINILGFFVLFCLFCFLLSGWHKVESSRKGELQLRKCFHQSSQVLGVIFLINVDVWVRIHATVHPATPRQVALGCKKTGWASHGDQARKKL